MIKASGLRPGFFIIILKGGLRMKKRLLSIAICFVMLAGLLAGIAMPIYAEEEVDGENVKL